MAIRLKRLVGEIACEPPFRLVARELLRLAPGSLWRKAAFGAVDRPPCLAGTLWQLGGRAAKGSERSRSSSSASPAVVGC